MSEWRVGEKLLVRYKVRGLKSWLELWEEGAPAAVWEVSDAVTAEGALRELRGELLSRLSPEEVEAAAAVLGELEGLLRKACAGRIVVEGDFGRLTLLASDGAVLRAAMLYYKKGAAEWLGELTYCAGVLQPPEEEGEKKRKEKKGVWPILALAKAEGAVAYPRLGEGGERGGEGAEAGAPVLQRDRSRRAAAAGGVQGPVGAG